MTGHKKPCGFIQCATCYPHNFPPASDVYPSTGRIIDWFPKPVGKVRRRIHGASRVLRERAAKADAASKDETNSPEQAAALRGKKVAYNEAAALVDAIENGTRLDRRFSQ